MYNTLEFLGFGENFIHWIQLLNKNFTVSVLQVGVKSKSFGLEEKTFQVEIKHKFKFRVGCFRI